MIGNETSLTIRLVRIPATAHTQIDAWRTLVSLDGAKRGFANAGHAGLGVPPRSDRGRRDGNGPGWSETTVRTGDSRAAWTITKSRFVTIASTWARFAEGLALGGKKNQLAGVLAA